MPEENTEEESFSPSQPSVSEFFCLISQAFTLLMVLGNGIRIHRPLIHIPLHP